MSIVTINEDAKATVLALLDRGFDGTSTAGAHEMFTDKFKAKAVDVYYNENGRPVVTFEVFTEQFMANSYGIVHGGCTATLVDLLSSVAIVADRKYWSDDFSVCNVEEAFKQFGVSRNINTQYLKAIPLNKKILVECTVELNSQRYSYYRCKIMDEEKKAVYVLGSHDKVKLYAKLA